MRRVLVQSAVLDCRESPPPRKRIGLRRRGPAAWDRCPGLCNSSLRDCAQLLPIECCLVAHAGDGQAVRAGKTICDTVKSTPQSQCAWAEGGCPDSCSDIESRA